MDSGNILNFLSELNKNNNREWFTKNKSRYEKCREDFIALVDELIPAIAVFDKSIAHLEGKKCVFRIYRDVRFSLDKSPYKTHFGAMIMSGASKTEIHSAAGYYIHIEPGQSMLAGGAYMPPSDWLKAIRKEIAFNAAEFKKIIGNKNFVKYFGGIDGEKLQRPPQGFDADHPEIELLKYKSYLAVHMMSNKDLGMKNLEKHIADVFKAMYPLNKFLREAGK